MLKYVEAARYGGDYITDITLLLRINIYDTILHREGEIK